MALSALLQWMNTDSTADLNARFKKLFKPGIISGTTLLTVSGQMQVRTQAFTAISYDGMLIVEPGGTVIPLLTPGQVSVVTVFAQYNVGSAPALSYQVLTPGDYTTLLNQSILAQTPFYYTVIAYVTTQVSDTQVSASEISYANQNVIDNLGRSPLRGVTNRSGFITTGDITDLGYTIINIPSTAQIPIGADISGIGLQSGSKVTVVNSSTSLTIDLDATATQVGVSLTIDPFLPYLTSNLPGDFYLVTTGASDIPEMYVWNGTTWVNISNAQTLTAELLLHRQNMYANEIHLTNDQAAAALGTYGLPSVTNQYVTQLDTRVPTQNENNALVGSDGSPSATNVYITQQFPIAQETFLSSLTAPPGPISVTGTLFVGTGGVGTAQTYFMILDYTYDRAYVNASELVCSVIGVFTDSAFLNPLIPSTNVNVDSNGFFTGTLYLQTPNSVNTGYRLLYGVKQTLQTATKDLTIRTLEQVVPASVVQSIMNIKGRPYDDSPVSAISSVVPAREQNINLRLALDSVQSYLGSVLNTNIVAAQNDYVRLAQDPVIGANFVQNAGIVPSYTFYNTGELGFSYNSTTGIITYTGSPVLTSVRVGDLWQDEAGTFFKVSSVGVSTLGIVYVTTGVIPQSSAVVVTAGGGTNPLPGSVQINNNPRNLLLSEMKFGGVSETIMIPAIVPTNEFTTQGYVTFGVVRGDTYQDGGRVEPRLLLYGQWENAIDSGLNTYVRTMDPSNGSNVQGGFVYTGFFTDLVLLCRKQKSGPPIKVTVNEASALATTISTSGLSLNADSPSTEAAYQRIPLTSGQSFTLPTTVRVDINTGGTSLQIYGIEVIRRDPGLHGILESGVAFDNTDLVITSSINTAVSLPIISGSTSRGGRYAYGVEAGAYSVANSSITPLDYIGSFTVTGGIINVVPNSNWSIGDIIDVRGLNSSSHGVQTITQITAIGSTNITVSPSVSTIATGSAIYFVCSSTSSQVNLLEEQVYTTYNFTKDLRYISSTDFRPENATSSYRYVVCPDGINVVTASLASVIGTAVGAGINEQSISITAGQKLIFNVLANRLDLVVNNTASVTVQIKVNSSPLYQSVFLAGSAYKEIIFRNARYQSNEVEIDVIAGTLIASKFMLYGPIEPSIPGLPPQVADASCTACYNTSNTTSLTPANLPINITGRFNIPNGGIYYAASANMAYSNIVSPSTPWTRSYTYPNSYYGLYISTGDSGAVAEFYFLGTAFELNYIMGPTHGNFTITVDSGAFGALGTPIASHIFSTDGVGLMPSPYTPTVNAFFAAGYARGMVGIQGLALGYHHVQITNNSSANMAFEGYYTASIQASINYQSMGFDPGGYFSGTVDSRKFLVQPSQISFSDIAGAVSSKQFNTNTFSPATVQRFFATGSAVGYIFIADPIMNVSQGDTYTNNGVTFTVTNAVSGARYLLATSSGAPQSSGTLSVAIGSGTASIAFTAAYPIAAYTLPSVPRPPTYLKIKVLGAGGGGGGSGLFPSSAAIGGTGSLSAFATPSAVANAGVAIAFGGTGGMPHNLGGAGIGTSAICSLGNAYVATGGGGTPGTICTNSVVAVSVYASSSQALISGSQQIVQFNTTSIDTNSAYNTSTYTYTAPAAGIYEVDLYYAVNGQVISNIASVNVGGTVYTVGSAGSVGGASGSRLFNLAISTTIIPEITPTGANLSLQAGSQASYMTIKALGGAAGQEAIGGAGGASALGGGAAGSQFGSPGNTSSALGSGGGGASCTTANGCSAGGGGAGTFIESVIANPLELSKGTFYYAVGTAGTAGIAATGGAAGGAGQSGAVFIEEYYN